MKTTSKQSVKKTAKTISGRILCATAIICLLLSAACNKKEEETEDYVPAESVALTAFSINPDARVMTNLDSVYFAIDLSRGVVYNPDSLPKGTFTGRLIPKISYPATVASATFTMQGGTHRADAVTDYIANPNDTIDFTGNVTLTLANADGSISRSYTVKVNVHKENPDSLVWSKFDKGALLSRQEHPAEQKTVSPAPGASTTLIREGDGTFTLTAISDLFKAESTRTQIQLPFSPDIKSLAFSGGAYYMLDTDGNLHTSADCKAWSACGTQWKTILGDYSGTLLGIRDAGGERMTTSWPESTLTETPLPDGFPSEGFSNMLTYKSRWSPDAYALICGGRMADGTLSRASWTFDGTRWADIAESPMPALYAPTLVNYYTFRKASNGSSPVEFDTLIAIGGRDADGNASRTLYLSYDNGISWVAAPAAIALPAGVAPFYGADAIVADAPEEMPVADYWKSAARLPLRRIHDYEVADGKVMWKCPYIFLFGGTLQNGTLNAIVYRTLLMRLSFAPLF